VLPRSWQRVQRASTKQIGRIKVAKIESKGRGFRRLRIQISD
jgi:misacylated tRNA(Ala) deacylase